jgi:CRP/FNR family transcriptional regulator, cyclic AMP receptor protein
MDIVRKIEFSPARYLATIGIGRRLIRYKLKHILFSQGSDADAVFYLQSGRAKLTVISKRGKEATVTLLATGDFIGEESIASTGERRKATASAVTACVVLGIDRHEMIRVLHEEHSFSDFFLMFTLGRSIRTRADLIDQLFNSSERRLARILLLMADYGKPGEPEVLIPPVTQETLAGMIGTTRTRVSLFMNRFRKLGHIEYNSRIRVNKSLLNVALRDQLPEGNSARPKLLDPPPSSTRDAKQAKIA